MPQDHERGDGKGRTIARRHMAPVGGTAHFLGPDSRTGRALFTIRCRNAGLRVYPADSCSYCHACRRSSYSRIGACINRRRTSTRTAIRNPSIISRSRCSRTGARGGRAYALTHAWRNARNKGLTPQHGSDVPCHIGGEIGHPRGVWRDIQKSLLAAS